ncbi:hypothetical protein SAMN05444745_11126 [Arthrobacter sp. OV608]|nr:hypothetical protein SAMN05444745_11126 [Arthrobacter sp. OV608]
MTGRPQTDNPSGKITLVLDQPSTLDPSDDLRDGLSAIVRQGSHLWVANDETTSLERSPSRGTTQAAIAVSTSRSSWSCQGAGRSISKAFDIVDDTLWLLGHTARSETDQW